MWLMLTVPEWLHMGPALWESRTGSWTSTMGGGVSIFGLI